MLGRDVHQGDAGIVMRFPSGARLRALGLLVAMAALIHFLDISVSRVEAAEADAVKPLAGETIEFLARTKLQSTSPIYLRVFKEESELEVWKARKDGRFVLVKTYPICNWSGALGPKQSVGDRMAPEGFYTIGAGSLKPDSKYHLALNIGYPNALDRALGRTGDFIMVHGSCVSIGCFAMTDGLIEEIYAFARESIDGGQERVPLHVFPFRMIEANIARHAGHAAAASWAPLKEAYDDFDKSKFVPRIAMCEKRYVVNPVWKQTEINPEIAAGECPAPPGKLVAPVSRKLAKKLFTTPMMALGMKTRTPEDIAAWDKARTDAVAAEAEEKRKAAAEAKQADIGGVRPFFK